MTIGVTAYREASGCEIVVAWGSPVVGQTSRAATEQLLPAPRHVDAALLSRVLQALNEQALLPSEGELLLVDNASTFL
jgi:hypothetical protein